MQFPPDLIVSKGVGDPKTGKAISGQLVDKKEDPHEHNASNPDKPNHSASPSFLSAYFVVPSAVVVLKFD